MLDLVSTNEREAIVAFIFNLPDELVHDPEFVWGFSYYPNKNALGEKRV